MFRIVTAAVLATIVPAATSPIYDNYAPQSPDVASYVFPQGIQAISFQTTNSAGLASNNCHIPLTVGVYDH